MFRHLNLAVACLVIAVIGWSAASASGVVVYNENFNAFVNGNLAGQNGWVNNISDGLDVTGGVVIGDGSDGGSRVGNILAFNGGVASVIIEMTMRERASSGFQNLAGITDAVGNQFIQFGSNASGFYLRRQDGSTVINANIAGNDALSVSAHQFYEHRLTIDFLQGQGLWEVSKQAGNGGDGIYSTITTFSLANIGALISNQANWNGIALRSVSTADQFDNIVISAILIPEPATAMILTLGMGTLALVRGRHRVR